MNQFVRTFPRILLVSVTIALLCVAAIPAARAQSSQPLDKHARRIAKHLTKYRPGTYLDFEFRDSSESYGALGQLSENSFEFTNADTNKTETHAYGEVESVKNAKEYIGRGSESRHHIRLLVPIIVAAVAAGGVAAYEAFR